MARRLLIVFVAALVTFLSVPCLHASTAQELIAEGDRLLQAEEKFPASFEQALSLYRQVTSMQPAMVIAYLRIARVCLALGEEGKGKSKGWFEQGEQAAEKAVNLQESSADAHFLLAANRGNVVNLLPFWKVSPTILADLEKHLLRALALDPRHAGANHMMGMLLYRTPGPLRLLLVGKSDQVEGYLLQSVESDPNFAGARFDLAKFYQETGRPSQARTQAQAILALTDPTPRRVWMEKYRPAAEALLKSLPAQ